MFMDNHHTSLNESLFIRKKKLTDKMQSSLIDDYLGFKIFEVERELIQKYNQKDDEALNSKFYKYPSSSQVWLGLHPEAFQTPYSEIYDALLYLRKFEIKHIVDIGAAYGRIGIISHVLLPNVKFTGLELVSERVLEAKRVYRNLNITNGDVFESDVLESIESIPLADVYFIFDFSSIDDINKALTSITSKLSGNKAFFVVKGKRCSYFMDNHLNNHWKLLDDFKNSELKIYCNYPESK